MTKKIIVNEVKNSGLILEEPQPQDYHSELFGAVGIKPLGIISPLDPPPVLFPTGYGWKQVALDYGLPELQFNRNFDTFSCVIFAIAKALCYYVFKRYGLKITIAEMYNAFYAGVVYGRGTTIRAGMESFRTKGWVADSVYPFTKDTTKSQYFAQPPKTIQVMAEGVLTEWEFHWEVLPTVLSAIFEQYKRTLVVLTGFAWASYFGTGVYFDYNNPANHAFTGLEPSPKGNNLCDDTYPKDFQYYENIEKDELIKELDKTFKYGSAHYCWVTPKGETTNLLIKIINMLKRISRDVHGGLWFIKDNKKQKIEDGFQGFAALVDELGIDPKNNNLTDEHLKLIADFKFFGK